MTYRKILVFEVKNGVLENRPRINTIEVEKPLSRKIAASIESIECVRRMTATSASPPMFTEVLQNQRENWQP